ncbi:hypothetical protein [Pseudoxanthomonas sp. SGT-18]|uniref:hypothetical protein n=1 Tax=Pseudoxanthomonas sp. SGT-18 TaxID=2493087 RepID=UPI000F62BC49|nr:hypothetical protein [Pseudoxanthomonas sp. SGT-18]
MKKMIEISNNVGTEANWRNFMRQFLDLMLFVGLVQTDDPGQADPETHPWGTQATFIFRMNDAMQAVAPIFIRFRFADVSTSGTSTNKAGCTVTVASEINAGVMSGVIYSGPAANSTFTSGTALGVLGACATDGFFGVFGNYGGNNGPSVAVCRTCSADGVADAYGVTVLTTTTGSATSTVSSSSSVANMRFSLPRVQAVSTDFDFEACLLKPYGVGTSIGGELPAYLAWHALPEIMPMHGICGVLSNVMGRFDTFNVALVGNAPRTYIALPPLTYDRFTSGIASSTTRAFLAMLWE